MKRFQWCNVSQSLQYYRLIILLCRAVYVLPPACRPQQRREFVSTNIYKYIIMRMRCEYSDQWCVQVHECSAQTAVYAVSRTVRTFKQNCRAWYCWRVCCQREHCCVSRGLNNWDHWPGSPSWGCFLDSTQQRSCKTKHRHTGPCKSGLCCHHTFKSIWT